MQTIIVVRKIRLSILTFICFVSVNNLSAQKIIRYDLYVRDTLVNFTGKEKRAIAVNGQIPMPTLNFTEGDTAEIYVHNELNEETSFAIVCVPPAMELKHSTITSNLPK